MDDNKNVRQVERQTQCELRPFQQGHSLETESVTQDQCSIMSHYRWHVACIPVTTETSVIQVIVMETVVVCVTESHELTLTHFTIHTLSL